MKIRFTDGTNEVIVILNDSKLSESLVKQLPFTFYFNDYANNEKNGTLPEKLVTDKNFEAECPKGSLGYFAQWGNLCLFFEIAPAYPGQYLLGTVQGDSEKIKKTRKQSNSRNSRIKEEINYVTESKITQWR